MPDWFLDVIPVQILLRDPLDDKVAPIVEELRRRLKPVNADDIDNISGRESVPQHDLDTGEEDGMPYSSSHLFYKA